MRDVLLQLTRYGKVANVSNDTTFILIAGVYHMIEGSEELGLSVVMVLDTNYWYPISKSPLEGQYWNCVVNNLEGWVTIDPDKDKTLLTDVRGKTVEQISHNNNEEKGKRGRKGITDI